MSLFHQIVDEHKELLKSKGYTEEALNSPDKPGSYMRMFAIQFSMNKQDAHRYNEKEEFELKTVGFFNNDKDVLVFKLNYQYDPEKLELSITQMTAVMDGNQVNYELQRNEDLPSSAEVYQKMTQAKKTINTNDESLKVEKAKKIIQSIQANSHLRNKKSIKR